MQTYIMSSAALSSHRGIDLDNAIDSISNMRSQMFKIMFPYEKTKPKANKTDEYDEYFDELDMIDAARKEREANLGKEADIGVQGQK